jgi:hypothetical protein
LPALGGRLIIKPEFLFMSPVQIKNVVALLLLLSLSNNLAAQQKYYGFVDETGMEIIPPVYEDASDFWQGLAPVKLHGKWGCINKKGDVILPCEYLFVGSITDGLILGCSQANGCRYFDKDGKVVINTAYEGARPFWEGLAPVLQNGKWGVIDTKGKVVVPFIYEGISGFSGGVAAVFEKKKVDDATVMLVGLIDTKGKPLTPVKYTQARPANGGAVWGMVKGDNKTSLFLINSTGEHQVYSPDPRYSVEFETGDFTGNIAVIKRMGYDWGKSEKFTDYF